VCLGRIWTEGGFTLVLLQGWGVGSEVLLEQMKLNVSCRNKFIIVLLCGLVVDNNTFLKMCVLKVTGYTDGVGYETKGVCFSTNKIKGNEELIRVILKCTLLHNQNDGWTVT
jgi:hypothetical protein